MYNVELETKKSPNSRTFLLCLIVLLNFVFACTCTCVDLSINSVKHVQGKGGKTQRLIANCNKHKFVKPFELPEGYNKYEFPTARNENCSLEKLPIGVGVRIRNIRGVVDLNEELTMEMDLITSWRDYVLADVMHGKSAADFEAERGTDYIILESSYLEKLWQPDIVFSKSISITKAAVHSSRINQRPSRLKIFPDGFVNLYTRLIVKLYCPMDFTYFPADTQMCDVRLRSYAFSNNDVELGWLMARKHGIQGELTEVLFLHDRSHPNYQIRLHNVHTEEKLEKDALNIPEKFTYVGFSLSIKRKLTFHITQTFIPILFLVVITWLTFFIPLSNLEARIAVVMTTLLTMTNKFSEVGRYTPNVSYVNALDIYMLTSISVVFFTLLEFTFLYWIRMGRTERAQSRKSTKGKLAPKVQDDPELEGEEDTRNTEFFLKARYYVETFGFLCTFVFFIVFNIGFWPWIFIRSDYFNNEIDYNYNSP